MSNVLKRYFISQKIIIYKYMYLITDMEAIIFYNQLSLLIKKFLLFWAKVRRHKRHYFYEMT